MKKLLIAVGALALMFSINITSFAATKYLEWNYKESKLTPEQFREYSLDGYIIRGYVDKFFNYYAPIEYAETKDGMFVRTFEEESGTILTPDINSEFYDALVKKEIEEREKLLQAWTFEESEVTQEMKDAGYVWESNEVALKKEFRPGIDGEIPQEVYSQQDVREKKDGKNLSDTEEVVYDEDGNPIVEYGNGFITIKAIVQPEIQQACYVQFANITTSNIYEFVLSEKNDFAMSGQLPAGSYMVYDGGIKTDYISQYPAAGANFEVVAGSAIVVPITIGTVEYNNLKNGIKIDLTNADKLEDLTTSDGKPVVVEKEGLSVKDIIIQIVMGLIVIGIGFAGYKVFKRFRE